MSYICGDCKRDHPIPTREEDREGQPCVEALTRDRDHYRAMAVGLWADLDALRVSHHGWLIKRGESCENLRDIEKILKRYRV